MYEDIQRFLTQSRIVTLAAAVALGIVFVSLVRAAAQLLVFLVAEAVSNEDETFGFPVLGNGIYDDALVTAVTFLLIGGVLFAAFRAADRRLESCPSCLSRIPRGAAVCRYCGSDV